MAATAFPVWSKIGAATDDDALDMLLEGDRVAPDPRQREVGAQRLLVRDGPVGAALEPDAVEHRAPLVGRREGQQSLAARGAVQGRAPADLDAEPEGAATAALVDVEDLVAVHRAQGHGLARFVREPVEHRGGGAPQVEGFPDPMRQFEEAVAEPVGAVALLVADEAEQHEGVEHAGERPLGEIRRGLEILEAGRRRAFADDVEEIEALRQGGGARGDVPLGGLENLRRIHGQATGPRARASAALAIMLSMVHRGVNPKFAADAGIRRLVEHTVARQVRDPERQSGHRSHLGEAFREIECLGRPEIVGAARGLRASQGEKDSVHHVPGLGDVHAKRSSALVARQDERLVSVVEPLQRLGGGVLAEALLLADLRMQEEARARERRFRDRAARPRPGCARNAGSWPRLRWSAPRGARVPPPEACSGRRASAASGDGPRPRAGIRERSRGRPLRNWRTGCAPAWRGRLPPGRCGSPRHSPGAGGHRRQGART